MPTIETFIDIAAPAERVWAILLDFKAYPSWNPFIITISGPPREGARLQVQIQPPGRSAMTFRPVVVAAKRPQELVWLGRLFLPGLLTGQHHFRIEDQGPSCRFHQSEHFSGILLAFLGTSMLNATRRGFEAMNAALKQRAEA